MCSGNHDCGKVHKKILEEGIKKGRLELAREINSLLFDEDTEFEDLVIDIESLLSKEFSKNRELV